MWAYPMVDVARWGVWCAWCGALGLYVLKVTWPALDKLTAFGKANPDGAPPPRYVRWLGLSSRAVFTMAYAGGFLLNALLLFLALRWAPPALSAGAREWHPYLLYAGLLQVHLARRLLECLFVHRFSPRAISDAGALLAGAYYAFVCLGPWVEFIADEVVASRSGTKLQEWSGASTAAAASGCLLFVYANWHQHVAHRILADLRRPREQDSTTIKVMRADHDQGGADKLRRRGTAKDATKTRDGLVDAPTGRYGLPKGDWFEYVSSPHYLAEILIYVAFVMLDGSRSLSLWLILAFVIANLVRSALQTHRWYESLFPTSFPKHRRAIFPFLL